MCDNLKFKSGEEFFDILQNKLDFTIPKDIKKILLFNYYDCAIALSKFDSESLKEVEATMRNDFKKEMLVAGETMNDYLCRYAENQINFKFFGGQIKLINAIVDYCQKLYEKPNTPSAPEQSTSSASSIQDSETRLDRQPLIDGKTSSNVSLLKTHSV